MTPDEPFTPEQPVREYCPEEHPETAERQARREARERYTTDEAWKDEQWQVGEESDG